MASRGRILIVDDEANARAALSEILRDEGYATETAADGFKALGKLEEFAPDVILTDLKMPGLDGIAFMEKARKASPGGRVRRDDRVRDDLERGRRREEGRRQLPDRSRSTSTALAVVIERAMEKARLLSGDPGAPRPAARAQRLRPHRLVRPADERGARARGAGRPEQGQRAHHGRERHRQGAHRRGDPPRQPARQGPVRAPALRGAGRVAARERALRPRARRVHRRGRPARGALRAGRRRDAVPRRDRRDPRRARR